MIALLGKSLSHVGSAGLSVSCAVVSGAGVSGAGVAAGAGVGAGAGGGVLSAHAVSPNVITQAIATTAKIAFFFITLSPFNNADFSAILIPKLPYCIK